MAIIDSRGEFSDGQDVTSTAVSTNVIDLEVNRDIGPGRTLYVVVTVDTAIAGSNPTVDIDIQTDDNESFSSADIIGSFRQLDDNAGNGGAAGDMFVLGFPHSNERFIRLNYTAGGTVSAGKLNAWLTDQEPYKHTSYADAIN